MARINRHEFRDNAATCRHCGTTAVAAANGFTCYWRDVPDGRVRDIAPEPALRIMAAEDTDAINARIVELRKQSETIIAGELPDEPMVFASDCCL